MPTESSARPNRILANTTLTLLTFFLLLLPRFLDQATYVYYLLCLLALFLLFANPRQLLQTDRLERWLFVAVTANFAWILVTYYLNGEPGQGGAFIWYRQVYFLMLIPLFFLFRRFPVDDWQLLLILLASMLLTSADIVVDVLQEVKFKNEGMSGNKFGVAQVCFAGIFALSWLRFTDRRARILALTGLLLSLGAIIAIRSKTAWIAVPVLLTFFLFYLPSRFGSSRKLGLLVLCLALIGSAYFIPVVHNKIDRAARNLSQYMASEHYQDEVRRGTIGTRLELWKAAWKMFLERPWTGYGLGGFRETVRQKSEQYEVNELVHENWHPHNQYLNALATRGIPGLFLMLSLMVLPAVIALVRRSGAPPDDQARYCILLLCIALAVMNFPGDQFESKSIIMFYNTMLALYLARISPGTATQDASQAGSAAIATDA